MEDQLIAIGAEHLSKIFKPSLIAVGTLLEKIAVDAPKGLAEEIGQYFVLNETVQGYAFPAGNDFLRQGFQAAVAIGFIHMPIVVFGDVTSGFEDQGKAHGKIAGGLDADLVGVEGIALFILQCYGPA